MVKNTIGGKRGKMMANKRVGNGAGERKLRLSMNENEKYVCVSKTFGGGMFEVIDNDGLYYKAILRGKMKGPNKRHNFFSLFSILLVGIRCDLSDSSFCDILFVFDDHDILSLSLLPNLNLINIFHFHHNHGIPDAKQHNNLFQIDSISMNDTVISYNDNKDTDTEHIRDFDFNDI